VLTYPDSPAPSASLDPDMYATLPILRPEDAIPVQCTPFGDVYLGEEGTTLARLWPPAQALEGSHGLRLRVGRSLRRLDLDFHPRSIDYH
jgi:hypothetical protein